MRISDWSSDVCSSDLRQGGRGLLAGHAAARGGGGMNAPVPGARASPGKTVVERMDSKELLDSALNALDRLLKMFMIESYVYLVLTAVSFLLLLYAGYLLVTSKPVSTELLVAVFGCSGLVAALSARLTWFFNRAFSLT